jgi:hypothetical protein
MYTVVKRNFSEKKAALPGTCWVNPRVSLRVPSGTNIPVTGFSLRYTICRISSAGSSMNSLLLISLSLIDLFLLFFSHRLLSVPEFHLWKIYLSKFQKVLFYISRKTKSMFYR